MNGLDAELDTGLDALERCDAEAIAAFADGEHAVAEAAWAAAGEAYAQSGFSDGLLVVAFNQLLTALDADDFTAADALMRTLGERLHSADSGPLTRAIAERICQLFAEPVLGIRVDTATSLVGLATERLETSPFLTMVSIDDLPTLPTGDALAQLPAEESLAAATALAAGTWGRSSLPSWLRAVQRIFGAPEAMPATTARLLADFATAEKDRDLLRGYPALAAAFTEVATVDAGLAAELQVGLRRLERRGLPERIRFLPNNPEERRVFAAIRLHGALADAVDAHVDAERLAASHWSAVEALADRWTALVDGRRARGAGRVQDVSRGVEVSIWWARARRFDGDIDAAADRLSSDLSRARRGGLEDPRLAAAVLLEGADLAERRGELAQAAELAKAAVHAALPGVADATQPVPSARAVARQLAVEDQSAQVLLGIEALTIWARATHSSERVDSARSMLAIAERLAEPNGVAEVAMMVELTATSLGSDRSKNAHAAALACDHPEGQALALYLGAAKTWASATDRSAQITAAKALGLAASAARTCPRGVVRRHIELQLLHAIASTPGLDDAPPLSVQVRRAASAVDGISLPDQASALFALCHATVSEAQLTGLLVRDGHHGLARRLAAAGRRSDRLYRPVAAVGAMAFAARSSAERHFEKRWVMELQDSEPLVSSALLEARPAGWWPSFVANGDCAQLEFRVYSTHTLAFLVDGDGVDLRRVNVAAETLRAWLVAEDGDALLFDALLGPFERRLQGARTLAIAADGPLISVNFATLPTPVGPLAVCLDIAMVSPGAAPAFDDDAAVAGPRLVVAGDGATMADIDLGSYADVADALGVAVRCGDELAVGDLEDALADARFVHLAGPIQGAGIQLMEDGPLTTVDALARAVATSGAVCVTLPDAAEDPVAAEDFVRRLACAVRGGVVWRRSGGEDHGFLRHFYAAAARAVDSESLVAAFGVAQRNAYRSGQPDWRDYSLVMGGR